MKKFKLLSILLCSIVLLALFTGCGSSNENNFATDNALKNEISGSYPSYEDTEIATDSITNSGVSGESTAEKPTDTIEQKIIKTMHYRLETLEFEETIKALEQAIISNNGYIQSSSISGNEYYDKHKNRNAEYVIRIPTAKNDKFTQYIDANYSVLKKEIDTEDVAAKYIDYESRLKALYIEKETFEKLLSQATNVNDLLNIQSKLTNVIYEIEAFESKIRTYDNLIDYTTIYVSIAEVYEPTLPAEEEKPFWEDVSDRFVKNGKKVIDGFIDVFAWFVTSIPQIVVFLLFAIPAYLILRTIIKKRKQKVKMIAESGKQNIGQKYYGQNPEQEIAKSAKEEAVEQKEETSTSNE